METALPKNDPGLINSFRSISSIDGIPESINEICLLIADGNLTTTMLSSVLNEYHINKIDDIKHDLLNLLTIYIKIVLEDGIITSQEAANIEMLKKYFKIKEGDFYKYKYYEIKRILEDQFQLIYSDNQIDKEEALHKVKLQDIFDLSFNQFDKFRNESLANSISYRKTQEYENLDLINENHTEIDPYLIAAAELIVKTQCGKTSLIKDEFKIGYTSAFDIMDHLEELGIVGPTAGSKAREVKIRSLPELNKKLSELGLLDE